MNIFSFYFFIYCVHFILFPKYMVAYCVLGDPSTGRDAHLIAMKGGVGKKILGLKQKCFSFLSNKKISTEVVHFFRYFSITEIIYRNIMIHNVNAPNTHTQPTGQTPTKLKKVLLHPSDHTPTTNRHQPQMLLNFLLNVRLKIA